MKNIVIIHKEKLVDCPPLISTINKLKDLGYNPKIMEVNVSNGRVLDRGVLMISENPIAIITAKKR